MIDIEHLRGVLKAHGLKATSQRIAVHKAMMALGHASADAVFDYITSHDTTSVTIASVYNILLDMACLKVYSRRLSSNNKMYFDVNNYWHAHMYDTKTNSYRDIVDERLAKMMEDYFKGRRFKGLKVDYIDLQIVCHSTSRSIKTSK